MNKNEIMGTMRSAILALSRAKLAIEDGWQNEEVMLSPKDTREYKKLLEDCHSIYSAIERKSKLFGEVSESRLIESSTPAI